MDKPLTEIDSLREQARLWYRADGSSEMLDSAEEVVRRRIEAAKQLAELDRLRAERDALLAACKAARRRFSDLNGRVARDVWDSSFETVEKLDQAIEQAERAAAGPTKD